MSQDAPLTLTFHIRSDDGLLEANFRKDLLKVIIQTPKISHTPTSIREPNARFPIAKSQGLPYLSSNRYKKPISNLPPTGTLISLFAHANVVSQRYTLVAFPYRCLPVTRQGVEGRCSRSSGALPTSRRPRRPWRVHHLPRRLTRLFVRDSRAAG